MNTTDAVMSLYKQSDCNTVSFLTRLVQIINDGGAEASITLQEDNSLRIVAGDLQRLKMVRTTRAMGLMCPSLRSLTLCVIPPGPVSQHEKQTGQREAPPVGGLPGTNNRAKTVGYAGQPRKYVRTLRRCAAHCGGMSPDFDASLPFVCPPFCFRSLRDASAVAYPAPAWDRVDFPKDPAGAPIHGMEQEGGVYRPATAGRQAGGTSYLPDYHRHYGYYKYYGAKGQGATSSATHNRPFGATRPPTKRLSENFYTV